MNRKSGNEIRLAQNRKMKQPARRNVKFMTVLPGLFLLFVMLCPDDGMAGRESLPVRVGDQALNKKEILAKAAAITIPFVKNAGQFAGEVTYAADLFAGRFFLTNKELVYQLRKSGGPGPVQPGEREREATVKKHQGPGRGLVFREFFVNPKGAKIDFRSAGEQQAETVVSYFRGSDSSRWRSGVASYQSVSLGRVYPGVEVKLKASGRNVEKVFYVSPRGNVDAIRIGVAGVAGLKIANDGRLLLKNTLDELAMRAPIAWQEIDGQRHDIKVGYRLLGEKCYGFKVIGDYKKDHLLIIDPDLDTLMASTYVGGNSYDILSSLALDRSGNVFVAGRTNSINFPTSTGAFDSHQNEKGDIFVAKLNGSLTKLLASTFLGGGESDGCNSLALDSSGNVYLTGYTRSRNFPTTQGAFDWVFNGGDYSVDGYGYGDVFISKLDNGLAELLASTYLGGSGSEIGNSLDLDGSGNVFLTGITESVNFPVTEGAYDQTHNASNDLHYEQFDAFISKFDRDLTKLQASTFLGGGNNDSGYSLVLDGLGNVYLTGYSYSRDFPATAEAYAPNKNGVSEQYPDAFISKLNDDLTALLASTYLGGGDDDFGNSLALDSYGNVYVTGVTGDGESGDFPTTQGAYCRENNGWHSGSGDIWCTEDVFVSKLDNDLGALLASTYLGAYNDEVGNSLALDSWGNVYVTGTTQSKDFPTTAGAYDRTYDRGEGYYYSYGNVYVSMLDSNLTFLLASTYLGSGYSQGSSLALDNSGNVFLAGTTNAKDFPTTAGAYDRSKNDNDSLDIFVSKLKQGITMSAIEITSPDGRESWLAGTTRNIAWKTIGAIADVKIEYTNDNGAHWIEVIASTANNGSYPWIIPATPSSRCLVRISDAANAAISDTSGAAFSILLGLDLQAERREIRALSIMRQYGAIRFLYANPDYPSAQYLLLRRKGNEGFVLLKAIAASELQNNQFQMQDKYLEKNIPYKYRVKAYDAAGQLIAISSDKTI